MKKIILLILLSYVNIYSQENNFTVENNTIIWKKIFESSEKNIQLNLNSHPKLTIDNQSYFGKIETTKCKCNNTSIFLKDEFRADFNLEIKEEKYRISVYNIRFKNSNNIIFENLSTNNTEISLEDYALKKDNSIRTNNQMKTNLSCLNDYFTELFTVKKDKSDW